MPHQNPHVIVDFGHCSFEGMAWHDLRGNDKSLDFLVHLKPWLIRPDFHRNLTTKKSLSASFIFESKHIGK